MEKQGASILSLVWPCQPGGQRASLNFRRYLNMDCLNLGSPETKIQVQVIYLGITGNTIWRVGDNEHRKEEKTIDRGCICKLSNHCDQLEHISHGDTTRWCKTTTLSSTHILFPQIGDLPARSHHPLVESCSPGILSWHFCLLHAYKIQERKIIPGVERYTASQKGQCMGPKITERCEKTAGFIECLTLHRRDSWFKPQHQKKKW